MVRSHRELKNVFYSLHAHSRRHLGLKRDKTSCSASLVRAASLVVRKGADSLS